MIALPAYVAINGIWIVPLTFKIIRSRTNERSDFGLFWLLGNISMVLSAIIFLMSQEKSENSVFATNSRAFYETWSRRATGKFRFAAHEAVRLLAFEALNVLAVLNQAIPGYALAFMFIFVAIPVAACIWTARLIVRLIMREGHWLCLTATLTTSILFTAVFDRYLEDPRLLWAIALVCGIGSGATAFMFRKLAIGWIRTQPGFATAIAVSPWKRIVPARYLQVQFARKVGRLHRQFAQPIRNLMAV